MDNTDLKKWLNEQISYLEKMKEQPDKFSWDLEYDLQLAAFRLAIEALHETCNHFREVTKMVPLTLEQLREKRGKWVWIISPDEHMTVEAWAYVGESQVFTYWEYQEDKIVGRVVYNMCDYGVWLAYAYPPAHIDRCAWVSVSERMPDEDQVVIVIANGKPRENITLDGAFELAEWSERDGWFLECWPEWEDPVVTHWMQLPKKEAPTK